MRYKSITLLSLLILVSACRQPQSETMNVDENLEIDVSSDIQPSTENCKFFKRVDIQGYEKHGKDYSPAIHTHYVCIDDIDTDTPDENSVQEGNNA